MYIKKIKIENIRSIAHLELQLDDDQLPGWHVLIGDNGSGKSTVLQAIALALIGKENALASRQNLREWVTYGQTQGKIDLDIVNANALFNPMPPLSITLFNNSQNRAIIQVNKRKINETRIEPIFSVAFGPFRRFMGSDSVYKDLLRFYPRLAAHLSVFGEDIALSEALEWLKELNYKRLENRPEGKVLDPIKRFINQDGFLPHGIRLAEISSENVTFLDAKSNNISVANLSDGYRSILSMTFEIIRQLHVFYPEKPLFSEDNQTIIASGIVLIDEIDAHLHPEWQRRIGFWFLEHFPNMQFIVTTHSPLVCQAASHGSIWRLPAPGDSQSAYQITKESEEWKRLVYGDILEAYSTDLFGENIDRSPEAQAKLERIAALSAKEIHAPLSDTEEEELATLMAQLPETPYKRMVGIGND
jgi:predicted ATPase